MNLGKWVSVELPHQNLFPLFALSESSCCWGWTRLKKRKPMHIPAFYASRAVDELHVEVVVWDFQESCSPGIHSCGKYAHFYFVFFSHFVLHMWNTDVMAWGCSIDFVPVRERSRLLQRLDHLGARVSTCRHSLLHFSLCSKKMRLRVFEALGMGLL